MFFFFNPKRFQRFISFVEFINKEFNTVFKLGIYFSMLIIDTFQVIFENESMLTGKRKESNIDEIF